ncbi:unnamed protein product [Sphenostylis stenocarpa]|uniref:Uncharacterized protein n=1 Tax=Sphenostylis stenocarpa TaxID=92480 RepID=A0AA86V6W0_9FABA|nr:unnamed protein product [Sphenostylis stenocarpa]
MNVWHRDRSGQTSTLLTHFFFLWDSHPFRPFLCKQTILNERESSHHYTHQTKTKARFTILRHSLSLSQHIALYVHHPSKPITISLILLFLSLHASISILAQFRHYSIQSPKCGYSVAYVKKAKINGVFK